MRLVISMELTDDKDLVVMTDDVVLTGSREFLRCTAEFLGRPLIGMAYRVVSKGAFQEEKKPFMQDKDKP